MTMKIKIEFTLNINPETWARDYGLPEFDKAAIREDVKRHIQGKIEEEHQELGHLLIMEGGK